MNIEDELQATIDVQVLKRSDFAYIRTEMDCYNRQYDKVGSDAVRGTTEHGKTSIVLNSDLPGL